MSDERLTPSLRRTFRDLSEASLGTVGPDGAPHVAPVWFVWRDEAIYCSTRRGSRSWLNAELDPRVSVSIDRGQDWADLAGIILEGAADLIAAEHPTMRAAMSDWHQKYRSLLSGDGFERFTTSVPELGFLRLAPEGVHAWDHRASPR